MFNKTGLAVALAGLALAIGAPGVASAEDPSLHGFADVSVKNDYITPRGLVVTTAGTTIQALDGLVLDFPQAPGGLVTDVSVVGGTWMDWNPGYDHARNSEAFNEFDWFVGFNVKLGRDWKAGVQYVEFISPQKAFKTERNVEFSLAFDDGPYMKPISFQPYVKLFYAASGDSTVVVGRKGGTFDVELGATPSIDLHPYGAPLILSAPTWITVGPSSFWGAGGSGVVSTGIKATYPIPGPASAGHWSLYAGYQYYHLLNDRLVLAEQLLNGRSKHDLGLWSFGVGLGF